MRLTADQCALYAQVIPVFMLAAVVAAEGFSGGPRATGNPLWIFATPIILGAVATLVALTSSREGAGPIAGQVITFASGLCITTVTFAAVWTMLERRRNRND